MIHKTFSFYDKKGRRLSIFGEVVDNKINITIIPCSKHDKFYKDKANILFNTIGAYKELHIIPIIDNKSMKSFINWCETNFYRLSTRTALFKRDILINTSTHNIIPNSKFRIVKNLKMSL